MAKRGNYGRWSTADMEMALSAYNSGEEGLSQCSRDYNISKSTLLRHIRNTNKVAKGSRKLLGRNPTFEHEIERLLCEHITNFSKYFFGLTIRDVRKLAFDVAEKNNISHQFNKEKKLAGKKWYYKFISRNKNLSLRQPQSTSLNRIRGFNRENVTEFFDLLENVCDKHKISATTIFNMDESGFSTVAKKCQKVVATKGTRAVGSVASGERGVNTTAVCCISASGLYVPPMIIFKRKKYTAELSNGAPPGSKIEISDSGYITSELFVKWLQHFINVVHPTKQDKVVLLLDGHTTHCKNLEALILARENGVILMQLPGHTTHRLQPLDRSFFKPMEVYYTQASEKWLRSNPGRTITQYQVAGLINEAYGRAATVETAINGFKAAGIWPINRHVFKDSDFVASEYHIKQAIPLRNNDKETFEENENEDSENDDIPLTVLKKNWSNTCSCLTPTKNLNVDLTTPSKNSSNLLSVSIEEIAPLPSPKTCPPNKRARGIQKAVEITSSPYKEDLETSLEKRKPKKKIVPIKDLAASGSTFFTTPKRRETDGWFCKECKTTECKDMIQCMKCKTWFHCECVDVSAKRKKFICIACTE